MSAPPSHAPRPADPAARAHRGVGTGGGRRVDTRSSGRLTDLWLGVRLAIGGGSGSWSRLALTAAGVGLGVAVLLLAAALPAATSARDARADAASPAFVENDPDPKLLYDPYGTYFRGDYVDVNWLQVVGPDAPVPPGIDRLPAPGEMFVSRKLADSLAGEDGALLRPRLPYTQVGVIGDDGVAAPNTMLAYVGAELDPELSSSITWGQPPGDGPEIAIVLLSLVGAVVVLLPVVVLLAASTRIAAAARERRLAAFRLVGADARQAGRLASGEALVSAVIGVGIGVVLFLLGRELFAYVEFLGLSVFATDLMPSVPAFALVVLVVPAVAVLTAVVSLRRAVVNPLGATRESSPPRRRLWWRLVPLALGAGLLVSQAGAFGAQEDPGNLTITFVLLGLALTGVSVPVLLPWLVQSAVGPLSGGPPSWQLAIRRIQLDSGTPARAAGGLAAVLTAAVAFQTLLASAFTDSVDWNKQAIGDAEGRMVSISSPDAFDPSIGDAIGGVDGVRGVRVYAETYANELTDGSGDSVGVRIAPCATIRTFLQVTDCADGDAFIARQPPGSTVTFSGYPAVDPGTELEFLEYGAGGDEPTRLGRWTIPADATTADSIASDIQQTPPGTVVLTPAAAPPAELTVELRADVAAVVDPANPDAVEHIANAFAQRPDISVYAYDGGDDELTQLRNALVGGALLVLLLAAASLLIVSVEQIRERRRQLAALAASGVGTRTLASSILWQATVPFGVAVVASLAVGSGLGIMLMRIFDQPATFDWAGMALLLGATTVAVLVVTGLTLPSLRRATRPDGLRME